MRFVFLMMTFTDAFSVAFLAIKVLFFTLFSPGPLVGWFLSVLNHLLYFFSSSELRKPLRSETMAPLSSRRSSILFLCLALVLSLPPSCSPESQREEPSLQPSVAPEVPSELYSNLTNDSDGAALNKPCSEPVECRPGIVLPVWKPINPSLGEQIVRAVVYFVSLMYMFLGVSIIADRFMASIEVITSQVSCTRRSQSLHVKITTLYLQ